MLMEESIHETGSSVSLVTLHRGFLVIPEGRVLARARERK